MDKFNTKILSLSGVRLNRISVLIIGAELSIEYIIRNIEQLETIGLHVAM